MAAKIRSIRGPIVLGSITVALSIALLVGWTLLIAKSPGFSNALLQNVSLLIGGIVSIVTIITVLVLFSIFLVREIQEVRRQYSFIDSVTHELKSPLASLKLCLETISRHELQDEQREQLRGMMLRDVDRLSMFIDDILEASRLSHGRSYALEPVALLPLVHRCADMVSMRHSIRYEWLDVDVPGDLELLSDNTALETIVKNLLDNAIKYSRSQAKVRVSARLNIAGAVELSVQDEGIGVPKAHLRRVFERFYRVPTEDVYTRQGSGLGLFVVASLVRALGGTLEAHSQGEGQGTTVVLRLPAGVDSVTTVRRLLLVEDEDHLATALKLNLELEGFSVDVAPTARRVRELLLSPEPYNAIILDVMLPDIDGFQLCAKLREVGNFTPVLMLTARGAAEDRVRGLDWGADDYLVKPFALDELLARVRSLLRRRQWEREQPAQPSRILEFGEAIVDFDRQEVTVRGEALRLTQLELDLLHYFADNAGRVLSREELLEKVWKLRNYPNTRTVDNFVARLRKHFEPDPDKPRFFLSHRGTGYKFQV